MGKWKMVRLGEVCSPKQWKTISTAQLLDDGYPVYGANGKIGFYSQYTHKKETVLVTCRGATCGTVNICEKYSYVNGNAMALDNLSSQVKLKYLTHYLQKRGFSDVITGSAQPQIIRSSIEKILIPVPPLDVQQKIADVLDKASALIELRRAQLDKLDLLIKSQFIEMFGDPVTNPMRWPIVDLHDCLISIDNGKSFVCESESRTGNYPAVLKLSAVTYGHYQPGENKAVTSAELFVKAAEVHDGDLLFTRKNTPELVGMCAYIFKTPSNLMMPDLIFRLNTNDRCNKIYLWQLINHDLFRNCIQNLASGSAKSMSNISKERLSNLCIILPPRDLQKEFADFVSQVENQKQLLNQSLSQLELNYKSLMQKCFRGELF